MGRTKEDGRGRLGGRAKGTPNKVTCSTKEWIADLIDRNRKQIEDDLKNVKPIERLQIFERLMPYVLPKQQAVSASIIDFEKFSDEQLDMVVGELTKQIDDGLPN